MHASNNALSEVKGLFAFPFRDPEWRKKFLIGSGAVFAGYLVPLAPWFAVMGYGARIARRAAGEAAGMKEEPSQAETMENLPEWNSVGDLLMDGLRQFGVAMILSLPIIIIMMVGYTIYMAGTFTFTLAGDQVSGPLLISFLLSFAVFWITLGLTILLTPVMYLLMIPAQAHVALERRFGAFFDISNWFGNLRRNFSTYLVILFLLLGLYMLLMFTLQVMYLTVILCFLFPVVISPITFYAVVIYYRLVGLSQIENR